MRKILFIISIISVLSCKTTAQTPNENKKTSTKLVIGIVVDQMRYDYLTRFSNKFGVDGFNRLINEGYNFKNHHFNYAPTYTGPGHASIFTGTSPMNHGIIGNYWYDKYMHQGVYCVEDTTVISIGTESKKGLMSPRRMKTTTFGDQLKLHTQQKSKVIGISLKDRGAILPAGHSANTAYWFHGEDEGKWITSSYYTQKLPNWVSEFNNKTKEYIQTWNTILPIESYTESGNDLNVFETPFKGKKEATFPYDLKKLASKNKNYSILKATPFGNDMTTDFAIKLIKNEQLGADQYTDVLTVSYSATDYVGHQFGVNSIEVEDSYIRLDRNLSKLFKYLDTQVGKGKYTLFLTADHGAVQVPNFLKSQKIPAGYFNNKAFKKEVETALLQKFKYDGLVEKISNQQIFLNHKVIKDYNLDLIKVQEYLTHEIVNFKHIDRAFSAHTLNTTQFTSGTGELVQNGFHPKHSGDVVYVLEPAVISYPETGSTHGSSFSYDTHVPLLFYGNGIKNGSTLIKTEVIDIAPTISALLGIEFPNGCTGKPLEFILN